MTLVLDFAPAHWTSGTRLVALALADRVNQDWEAWPSLEDIARRSGLSTRQVRTHLRLLEQERIITCQGQRVVGPHATTNLWTWLWKLDHRAEAHFRPGRKPTSHGSLTTGRKPTSAKP
jgi:DNA-binding IclR family transcriptional regulator